MPTISAPNMLASAVYWSTRGVPVFPLWWPREDGSCACGDTGCTSIGKHPLTAHQGTWYTHRGLHDATTDAATIAKWWRGAPLANIGIRTGVVYDVIDIDGPTGEKSYTQLVAEHGMPFHVCETVTGRAAGGRHLYIPVGPDGGVKALAGGRTSPPGIDVKGAGGYVIAPDSLHASGRRYGWKRHLSEARDVGTVPWPRFYQLLKDAAPKAEAVPLPLDRPRAAPSMAVAGTTTPYGAKVLSNAVALVRSQREGSRWQTVATEALVTVARAIDGQCLDRHQALGELDAAARAVGLDESEVRRLPSLLNDILAHGITNPIAPAPDLFAGAAVVPVPVMPTVVAQPVNGTNGHEKADEPNDAGPAGDDAENEQQDGEPERRTSWWPADLEAILSGTDDGNPKPVALARDDGARLLYPGRINMLIGESESGKTWVALHAVAQALAAGESCVYLDFEDSAAGVVGRLLALGVEPERIRTSLRYISPDEGYSLPAAEDLTETIATTYPSVVIVDGINAGMGLCGLDLNSNKDVTAFGQRVLRPLARTGAAVLGIDHVTKAKEGRGNYAIGAQAKRADVNGVAIIVEVVKPFGRGMSGKLRLTVSKDRPGHVRAISIGAKFVGTAIIESDGETGLVTMYVEAPRQSAAESGEQPRPAFRPTGLMERVSRFLEPLETGASTRTIREGVHGKPTYVADALDVLVAEGYVSRRSGTRGSVLHTSTRPYRESSDAVRIAQESGDRVVPGTTGNHWEPLAPTGSRVVPESQTADQAKRLVPSGSRPVPSGSQRPVSPLVPTPPPLGGGNQWEPVAEPTEPGTPDEAAS